MTIINVNISKHHNKINILNYQDNEFIININNKKKSLEVIQYAACQIRDQNINKVNLKGENWNLEKIWAFWLGYRDTKKEFKIIQWPKLSNQEQFELNARKKTIDWVRDIVNLPSNELTPTDLVNQSIELIINSVMNKNQVNYRIIQGDELLKNKYMGVYKVGCSSNEKPVFLMLDFNPNKCNNTPIYASLIGKGITFDSGGYNLKSSNFIKNMKSDMAGAATLVGSLSLAIKLGLKKRIKLYLCCAENMISNNSLKVGDIITYRNGIKVEVNNTDAEGRLIIADGLIDASKDNPEFIIDAATLTGAARIAVGSDYHALFTFDKSLLKLFMNTAKKENELFWQLPLSDFHRKHMSSYFADISNISNKNCTAGASTAAAFLTYFLKDYKQKWLHIDCSASYQDQKTNKWSIGATGVGVKTIARFLLLNN